MSDTIEIRVEGMGCQGCVSAVEKAVHLVAPASRVTVDLEAGHVQIAGGADLRIAIENAIRDAGYDIVG